MYRNYWSLLFFSAGVFLAGCSGHSGSSDGAAATPPLPAAPADVELAAFARSGLMDPEYVEPRGVNDVPFAASEQEAELNDVF